MVSEYEQLISILRRTNCQWITFNDDACIYVTFACTLDGEDREAVYQFNQHGEIASVSTHKIDGQV